jgi:predicted GIY-YIG superfamily endonuclease
MTEDLERRLKEHNTGKSKFTSGHRSRTGYESSDAIH